MPSIDPATLLAKRTADTVIVDIREVDEFASGHIHGAINIPLSEFLTRRREIPDGAYLICQTGSRSSMATQYLNAAGQQVINVTGGVAAWPEPLEV